eukprot:g9253.t1
MLKKFASSDDNAIIKKPETIEEKYGIFLNNLENQFPSIRKVFQEGKSTKRRLAPRYLRDDQPSSKFIVRSDALCSGYGKNKLVKAADQILQELEKHRIHKEPRRPRRLRRRRARKGTHKGGRRLKKRNRPIRVPRTHRTLKNMIVLGEEKLGAAITEKHFVMDTAPNVDTPQKIQNSVEAINMKQSPDDALYISPFSLKHSEVRNISIVEESLNTSPTASTVKNSKFIAQPQTHMAKLLRTNDNNINKNNKCNSSKLRKKNTASSTLTLRSTTTNSIPLSPDTKRIIVKQINKKVILGSPWSSLPLSLDGVLKKKEDEAKYTIRQKNDKINRARNKSNRNDKDHSREVHFNTKDEKLVYTIENRLHEIISKVEAARTHDINTYSHLINGNTSSNIVNRHVVNISSNAGANVKSPAIQKAKNDKKNTGGYL